MFSTELAVTTLYLNYGGHVGDGGYVFMAQEARVRWLKSYGMSETNLGDDIGYVIASVSMRCKAESLQGDVLVIEVTCANLKSKGFDFLYKMINKETGRVVATGETTQIFFNHKLKKISHPCQNFIEKFFKTP